MLLRADRKSCQYYEYDDPTERVELTSSSSCPSPSTLPASYQIFRVSRLRMITDVRISDMFSGREGFCSDEPRIPTYRSVTREKAYASRSASRRRPLRSKHIRFSNLHSLSRHPRPSCIFSASGRLAVGGFPQEDRLLRSLLLAFPQQETLPSRLHFHQRFRLPYQAAT